MNYTTSKHHTFDTELAEEIGVLEAILVHHFQHWITHNKKLGKNKKDGRTWTQCCSGKMLSWES